MCVQVAMGDSLVLEASDMEWEQEFLILDSDAYRAATRLLRLEFSTQVWQRGWFRVTMYTTQAFYKFENKYENFSWKNMSVIPWWTAFQNKPFFFSIYTVMF